MQRDFEKMLDEGVLTLEGEEADKKYEEIWSKVKSI
jgi:hypothetical protein